MKTSTWIWLALLAAFALVLFNWQKLKAMFGTSATAPANTATAPAANTRSQISDYVNAGTSVLAALFGQGGIFRQSSGNGDLTGEDLASANY